MVFTIFLYFFFGGIYLTKYFNSLVSFSLKLNYFFIVAFYLRKNFRILIFFSLKIKIWFKKYSINKMLASYFIFFVSYNLIWNPIAYYCLKLGFNPIRNWNTNDTLFWIDKYFKMKIKKRDAVSFVQFYFIFWK